MATLFGNQRDTRNNSTLFGSSSTDEYDIDRVNRSIDNARTRINDSGYTTQDADKRNWFEKATNLPENQNFLFDTLDIITRPGQGLVGGVNEAVKGGNFGKGFADNFSGRENVQGSELAGNLGIENKYAKAIVGTGLDIGLDPITYVPGGVLLKGAKGASKLASAPVKAGYNALENVSPQLKRIREEVAQPAYTETKDRLGYMFNPSYKETDTLSGGKSTALRDAFEQGENQRRFLKEEYTNKLTDSARSTGVQAGNQVGRLMEQNVEMMGPKPFREMSSDPKIQQAADDLMKSNQEIRELAEANGINVNELEGYMTHIFSKEERARRKARNAKNIDSGNFGLGQPNKSILKQREMQGSAEDINEQVGRNMFEPNAYFATAQGQRRLIDYVQSVGFRKQVLNDPDFAQPYQNGMDIPNNATVIDTNNYKFIKESGDMLEDVASKDIGGEYVVTKAVKEKLDRYKTAMTDEGSKAFLNAFDAAQSFWKRAALFSLPYHLRNEVGAKFNSWVGGMSVKDITKYSPSADKDVYNAMIKGKETPLYREYREQGLGATSQSQVEFERRGADPSDAIENLVKKQSKYDGTFKGRAKAELSELKNPLKSFETSRQVGDFIDQTNRFAMYKWAKDKGMNPREAAAKVRESQFDYTKLTNFERNFMTRAMPFYRWMRNNLPYQIKQIANDPRKYVGINKARLNAQDAAGIDENNISDFMKESFYIPVSGDGDGKGNMLGFNLPVGDLARLSDPLKMGIDSLSPLAKMPLELGMNRNFFFDKPIEKFEGQEKQLSLFGKDFSMPMKTAYALEQGLGQLGRGASKALEKEDNVDQDTKFRMPSLGISGVLKPYDVDQSNYYAGYNELNKLQDLINYIEQQTGTRPRTVNEIKKSVNEMNGGKNTLFGS